MKEISRSYFNLNKTQVRDIYYCINDDSSVIRIDAYYFSGEIKEIVYQINDVWSRADGPAYVYYNIDGSIYIKQYWFNDVYYPSFEDMKKAIKLLIIS